MAKIKNYELYSHNQIAYDKLENSLKKNDRACIVQPTGTGKSFITAELLKNNSNSKFLLLTSNKYIVFQFNEQFGEHYGNYDYIAYPSLLSSSFKQLLEREYDYIVLDEYHRVGAEIWGSKVLELIDSNKNAKVIGLTATHIRYSDSERDLNKELFNGNLVHHLSISECFDKGILPRPKYITAIYNIDEEFSYLIQKINNSKSRNKARIKERIIEYKAKWENANGADIILKKHIGNERNFIIFCKDIEHLERSIKPVVNWFKGFNKPIRYYKIYSSNPDSDGNMLKYQKRIYNRLDEFNLIFAVQQLNEGIHIKGIDGVIFLRPTESHIIYYQQLGRALETKGKQPIVFDMVNNFKKSNTPLSKNNIDEKRMFTSNQLSEDYDKFKFKFNVIDEVKDVKFLFEEYSTLVSDWNIKFEYFKEELFRLKKYDEVSRKLKNWFTNQMRIFNENGKAKSWGSKKEKLESLKPYIDIYTFDYYNTAWDIQFDEFKNHLVKKEDYDYINTKYKNWFNSQKKLFQNSNNKDIWNYRLSKLQEVEQYVDLKQFSKKIKPGEKINPWNERFEEVAEEIKEVKKYSLLSNNNKRWFTDQKRAFKKSKDSAQWKKRILKIKEIGLLEEFNKNYINYIFKNRSEDIEKKLKSKSNLEKRDIDWILRKLKQAENNKLPGEQIKAVNKIGKLYKSKRRKQLSFDEGFDQLKTHLESLHYQKTNELTEEILSWIYTQRRYIRRGKNEKEIKRRNEMLNTLNDLLKMDWKDIVPSIIKVKS